jgi:hypothetical protein
MFARMFFWMMVVEEATVVLVCPPREEVVWWTSWARPRHSSLHDNVEMTAITGGTSAKRVEQIRKKVEQVPVQVQVDAASEGRARADTSAPAGEVVTTFEDTIDK